MDHDKTRECYEFLDLSDVDDSERNHLTTALYSSDHNQHTSWVHDNDNTAVDQNIPAVQNSWHETPFGLTSEQLADVTSAAPPVVRNLVMPRLLTPLGALPIYAFVKPSSLAPIAAAPTICTPTTHVLSGAVTSVSSSDIDYIKDNQSQSAMSPQPTPQISLGANQQQSNMNNQHQQQQHQQQHTQQNNNQAVYAQQQQYIGQVGTQIGGAMYQMLPHVMPNVYVSNVSANVNVHGYMTQAIPQYMTNTTPTFVHLTEANQGGQLHEHQQTTNHNTNVSSNIRGNSRRGRGRGNGHRREYIPRSPPQQQQQQQQQHQQQQQEMVQTMMESQQVLGGASGFTQYYPINPYWIGHPSNQHASGSALYLSTGQIPMYATAAAGHQMYAYHHPGMMYQAMIPHDYGVALDEKSDDQGGVGQENIPNGTVIQQMWHPHLGVEYQEQQMEIPPPNQEEMLQLEMMEDVNQNIMQLPMQMNQHQTHQNQIPQQIPMHSPHVLNPNVATFTSLKTQQQYQNDYMVSSNIMVQQSISVNQHSNNQQINKIHQVQHQNPPPQPTPSIVAAIPPVLHQQNISEQISVNNPNKHMESKNLNVIYNKDLNQVPSTLVTNMNIKVPVATTATNINNNHTNKNNNSNFINNVNRISNNNNSVSPKINQNVPNPSSNSIDVVVSASGNSSTSFVNSNINDDTVNKLVKATNDKLMIKNERGNKPPAWNNNNSNTYNNSYNNNSNNNNNRNVNISNVSSVTKKVSNPPVPTVAANSNSCSIDSKVQSPPHSTIIVNYNQPIQKTLSTPSTVVNHTLPAAVSQPVTNNTRQKLSPPPFANNPAVVKSNNSPFVPKSNQMNSISPIIMSSSTASTIVTDPLRNAPQMVSNKKTETQKLVTTQNTTVITKTSSVSVLQPQQQLVQTQSQANAVESTVISQNNEPPSIANVNKSAIPIQVSKDASPLVNSTATSISPITNTAPIECKEKQQTPVQSNAVVSSATVLNPAEPLTVTTIPPIKEKETVTITQTAPATPISAPSTKSWASLFVGGKSSGSVIHSISVDQSGKKPVAKVFPFEGTVHYNPIQTPGGISYSAASSQGLSVVNNGDVKRTTPDYNQQNHPPSDNNIKVLDGWSSRLGVFFIKYQIDNNSACITPRGLTNRSNYCYINAILQALVSCPPFYNLLRSIPTQPSGLRNKSTTPIIDAMTDLVAEFSMMSAPPPIRITRREKGQKREDLLPDVNPDAPFEPTVIHKMLNGIRSDVFQVEGRQEDAEEFLGCVLNKMNDEMLEVMKMVDNKNKVANGTIEPNPEEQNDEGSDWQVICGSRNKGSITRTTDFGRTPISDIFRGQLRSRVQREGDASTDVVQPFFTLQLYIEKAASVKEALEILVVKDQLEGVTCSKTKQEVAAWQQVTIEELPIILILHLKCFDYKMDGCTKILKTVEFPIELKIDSKFLSSKSKYAQKQKQYKLFAVVYHDGKEAVKGHYLTDVFHAGYNSWIRYDDSIVKPVTEHHVLHPRSPRIPYLLYYRRCDTIGGGGGGGGSTSSSSSVNSQQQQSSSSK